MPELPEVETVVRGLREPLTGRTIQGAVFPKATGRMTNIDAALLAARIAGQTVRRAAPSISWRRLTMIRC
mgnify:CR=1 FL=1